MKELLKKSGMDITLNGRDVAIAALLHIGMLMLGFVTSKAVVLSTLMPFGLSFAAGITPTYIPSVCIGAFLGYFLPAIGSGGFRYIASLLAIVAIRLMLSSYKKISLNPLFLCVISASSVAITGAVTTVSAPIDALKLMAEMLLCGGGAFLVRRVSHALSRKTAGLTADELGCLLIVISVVLLGLENFIVLGLSLGRVLGVILFLTAAKYGGTLSGAVSGIAVYLTCALSGTYPKGCGIYAVAGMLAGIFSPLGKYAQAAAAAACSIIGASLIQFEGNSTAFIVEMIIGCALFLVIPRDAGILLGKIFSCYPKITVSNNFNKALTMRLDVASGALKDVSQTVEQVAEELGRINAPDFSSVLSYIEQDACAGCKLRIHCWESKKDDTLSALLAMVNAVKQNDYSPENSATEEFRGRCMRLHRMGEAVSRRYSDYASLIAAETRIKEVRSVVSDQFDGISNMLEELAVDFKNDEKFDNATALTAVSALKNIGICADECSARIDKYGRMTIEVKLKRDSETVLNRLQIMKMLSLSCERDFDVPSINHIGGDTIISINEHAAYKVDIGVDQICASGSSMCGDAYNYFTDGKGHFIMVLSDGMGTGGRAAVDGAMASGLMSRLLKAGFGYNCSLKILNSSMLFKSTDESLATVDIASIDLFTGETELYKAGAAPTVVRRCGRCGKAESTSLPVGILGDIGFDRAGIRLRHGDILLLMSDGAVSEGTDWIRAELEAWRDGSAEDLAEHICQCARRRRTDRHEDDITVMAAILEKAV